MKKTIIFLCSLILFPISLILPVDPAPSLPDEIDMEELAQGLKELTIAAFEQEHGRKPTSDDELKTYELKLQKDGEQMIEQIVEEGKKQGKTEQEALDEFFEDFVKTIQEIQDLSEEELEEPEEKIVEEEVPVAPTQKERQPIIAQKSYEVQTIQELITQIINALHSFRLKTTADKQMRDNLIAYKYRIDDLIYLLHVINDPLLIQKYFSDPAFAPLVENLKRFHRQLIEFEDRFVMQEAALETQNAYEVLGVMLTASPEEIIDAYQKKRREYNPSFIRKSLTSQGIPESQIKVALAESEESVNKLNQAYNEIRTREESRYIFESILSLIDQATDINNIQGDIKKVLEKYKQDALKEFTEREKIEKEARESHERSLRARPLLYPLAEKKFDWPKSSSFDRGFGGGGFSPSTTPSAEKEAKKENGAAGAGKKKPLRPDKKKDTKKKDDDKKKDEDKKKEEDKKKKAGAGKPEDKVDKEVTEQLGVVKDQFKQFEKLIIDNFNDLQDFGLYLTTPLPDADIAKAKKLQGIIIEMTSKLNGISKKVKDAFKDNEGKRKSFKAEVKKIVDGFNKKLEGTIEDKDLEKLKKDIKNVPDIKTGYKKIKNIFIVKSTQTIDNKPLNNEKKFVFFGEGDLNKIPAPVKALNKGAPEAKAPEPAEGEKKEEAETKEKEAKKEEEKPTNFMELLQKSYKGLEDLFKK